MMIGMMMEESDSSSLPGVAVGFEVVNGVDVGADVCPVAVGADVGAVVGADVGDCVGVSVGEDVCPANVGALEIVGADVGDCVTVTVGADVGADVGEDDVAESDPIQRLLFFSDAITSSPLADIANPVQSWPVLLTESVHVLPPSTVVLIIPFSMATAMVKPSSEMAILVY
jgi:hypothetical protein